MGLKNSAALFQDIMENHVLKGLNNVVPYQDDLIIYARTEESLNKHFNAVQCRLKSKGVTINENKTTKCAKTIEFLGRVVSEDGIKPSNTHLQKALQLKAPTNKKDIQSLMGFFNYFREFIPNYSSKSMFLTDKLAEDSFSWTKEDESKLTDLKQELLTEPVLKPYDQTKDVVIETDASSRAVAAIVTQNKNPIFYLSKKLTKAQSNWSNIEREAYAIYWTITKLRRILLGRKFFVKTDHKPLTFIFSNNNGISLRTSARVARWALELMPYDFELDYEPGRLIPHVDMLSRFSLNEDTDTVFHLDDNEIPFSENSIMCRLQKYAQENESYQNLISRIADGKWSRYNPIERKFYKYRFQLTVENGVIYYGTRLLVPNQFRAQILSQAHETHSGQNAMCNNIKKEFWWPGMVFDIIKLTKKCKTCCSKQPIKKSHLASWPESGKWDRVHIDWAMPKGYGQYSLQLTQQQIS